MPGIDIDIPTLRLNRPRGVDHFPVGIARAIALHPQAVARQNIAALVTDAVGK